MISRRALLSGAGSVAVARVAFAAEAPLIQGLPAGVADVARLEALPGKKPLIKLSYRPPNYETPLSYFTGPITPNDAFFVRYHLSEIPQVDPVKWRLTVAGGQSLLILTLDDLKAMPAVEVTAVCQCSGNRRGLSDPHVTGVEWGYGAMGCAKWKGPRLKDVLERAGVPTGTVEIMMNGADGPPLEKTPDFVKSLPLWKAMDDSTILAYEMNGEPLPHFNGAPARVIAPGWTATYWVKHLTDLRFLDKPFDGFWVKNAYRVPVGMFPAIDRFITQETATATPITDMVVNSVIVSPAEGARLAPGKLTVSGLAWDGGRGVDRVEVSTDKGESWREARLGEDLGRFAFRAWSFEIDAKAGALAIMARASNKVGQTQVVKALFNPAGYQHNVIQTVTVAVG